MNLDDRRGPCADGDEIDPFMMNRGRMESNDATDGMALQESRKYMGVQDTVGLRMWSEE